MYVCKVRNGYRVQYAGKQLLSTPSKDRAESFITKYLRDAGKIGQNETAPLKAKFRKKAMKKSNISGIILRAGGFYEGTSIPIGRHTTLESAASQLRAAIKKETRLDRFKLRQSEEYPQGSLATSYFEAFEVSYQLRRTTCKAQSQDNGGHERLSLY